VLAQPSFLLHASAGGYDNLPLELLRKWTLGAAQAHDLAVLGASLTLAAKGGRTLHSVVGGDVALASVFLGGITSQLCNGAASAKAVGLPESAAAEAIGVARNGLAANTTPSPAGACVCPLAAATPSLPPLLAHLVAEADSSTFMHLERCVLVNVVISFAFYFFFFVIICFGKLNMSQTCIYLIFSVFAFSRFLSLHSCPFQMRQRRNSRLCVSQL